MKTTRLAAWVMILLTAMPAVLAPSVVFAQAQPAAPAKRPALKRDRHFGNG